MKLSTIIDYTEKGLPMGEFVKCHFKECNFTGKTLLI